MTIRRLHSELACGLYQNARFQFIQHPLVYMVPFFGSDFEVDQANAMLEHKKLHLTAALQSKDWDQYIYLHERPHRLEAFLHLKKKSLINPNKENYWKLLGSIWTDSENIHQMTDVWFTLLEFNNKNRFNFMAEDDVEFYNSLPDKVQCYRGGPYNGMSYTLEYAVAERFSNRYLEPGTRPRIRTAVFDKAKIFAYINNRKEAEVIVPSQAPVPSKQLMFMKK